MKKTVRALILTGYGLNCEEETAFAFAQAGAETKILHLNELASRPSAKQSPRSPRSPFAAFDILAIPGGFAYGDHISSGRVFANKLIHHHGKDLLDFIAKGHPVIGICNGFQILVKAGILPDLHNKKFHQEMSLVTNESARYEDRWVNLAVNLKNPSFWLKDFYTGVLRVPVRHGEGRLVTNKDSLLKTLHQNNQIAFQYINSAGQPTETYPANPNGSALGIAGITNRAGNVLGLMPHPEAAVYPELIDNIDKNLLNKSIRHAKKPPVTLVNPNLLAHPRLKPDDGPAMGLFYNAVIYAQNQKY